MARQRLVDVFKWSNIYQDFTTSLPNLSQSVTKPLRNPLPNPNKTVATSFRRDYQIVTNFLPLLHHDEFLQKSVPNPDQTLTNPYETLAKSIAYPYRPKSWQILIKYRLSRTKSLVVPHQIITGPSQILTEPFRHIQWDFTRFLFLLHPPRAFT